MRIRPRKALEKLDALMEQTSDPKHRRMLEVWKEHMIKEIAGDVEGTLRTMVPHPRYHSYGAGSTEREILYVDGMEQNRALYQRAADEGWTVVELDINRVAFADWGLAGDGVVRIIFPGRVLAKRPDLGSFVVDDEDAHYLFSYSAGWFLPYEDGLMAGEDIYIGAGSIHVVKLDPADVVTKEEALA